MSIRIFTKQTLINNTEILLDDFAFNHLIKVLRLQEGANFKLFNGDGNDYAAQLIQIEKKRASAKIISNQKNNTESPLKIHLFQAIAKGDKMDFIVQKACELGISEITPIYTQRSIGRLDQERIEKKLQHWEAVAISACEQSGRSVIPIIHQACYFLDLIKLPTFKDNNIFKIILDPFAQANLKSLNLNNDQKIAIFIGPEGGLNHEEISCLSQNNCQGINLGPRILRTETAGIAIIATLQALYGDWG